MTAGSPAAGWERSRRWDLARKLVYYLVEDFVPPEWVPGTRAVDFSGGLGDLAIHLLAHGAAEVTVTVPDHDAGRPAELDPRVGWLPGVTAARIGSALRPGSVDLFAARMVFQFPTWEGDRADPDSMLRQIESVLASGGRVVVAVHEFFPFDVPGAPPEEDVDRLLERAATLGREERGPLGEAEAARLASLAEMVRFLGLPPRQGPLGGTGFGLKVPMLVDSVVRAGLSVETVEHVEPFTFPLGLERRLRDDPGELAELADRVFAAKRLVFSDPRLDPYERPDRIADLLERLRSLFEFVAVPVVRVVGRKE